MENTKIAWADHTFNPWIGCSKVASGCANCFAEAQSGRFGVTRGPNGTRRKTSEAYWRKPLKWQKESEQFEHWKNWHRLRVFPSLCDPFEDWLHPIQHHRGPQLTTTGKGDYYPGTVGTLDALRLATISDLRRDFFRLIDQTPNLDWLLLTKRPQNIRRMWTLLSERLAAKKLAASAVPRDGYFDSRENVYLLYSASDQETLEAGLPHLLACRDLSPVLGVSLEPLVELVDLAPHLYGPCGSAAGSCMDNTCRLRNLDWVIVGGESGRKARPCNIEWIESIVDQCEAVGVPCFVKQDSALKPGQQGRIPDRLWKMKEFPK